MKLVSFCSKWTPTRVSFWNTANKVDYLSSSPTFRRS